MVKILSETGGDESGIDVRWSVEQSRSGTALASQSIAIGRGALF